MSKASVLRDSDCETIFLGKTEKISASNLKLKVNVNGVSTADCQRVYASENREIVDSQVCAGGVKGQDSWFVNHFNVQNEFLYIDLFFAVTVIRADL